METILVQINDHKAYKLLEELEALNLLKVIRKNDKTPQNLSEKYAGKLSSEVAEELQAYVKEGRETWGKSDI